MTQPSGIGGIAGMLLLNPQRNAADRFRALCARAAASPLRGKDYSSPRVDGGPGSNGAIDGVIDARTELARIRDALDERGFALLLMVVVEERNLSAVAAALGVDRSNAGRAVKKALTRLADWWAARGAGFGTRYGRDAA